MIETKDCWMRDRCAKASCPDFCPKLFRMDYLYNMSLLSDNQRKHIDLRIDADGTDMDAFKRLKYYQDNIEEFVNNGYNLYIHSKITGNGKSAWSIRLMQAYFNAIWYKTDLTCRALFINVPRFLLALKDNISQKNDYVEHVKKYILTADLVVWDEIGIKASTTFEMENLLNCINARTECGKSNIYTSNMDSEELKALLGDRLYSRIVNLSEEVILYGQDKRGLRV